MSAVIDSAQGGRSAAIAHRKALSVGKAGLPPAQERSRTGKREAALAVDAVAVAAPAAPQAGLQAGPQAGPAPAPQPSAAPSAPSYSAAPSAPAYSAAAIQAGGRLASIQRRRELSQGKAALRSSTAVAAPPASGMAPSASGSGISASGRSASIERRKQLVRGKGGVVAAQGEAVAQAPYAAAPDAAAAPAGDATQAPSCRDMARARRAAIANGGRAGLAAPAAAQIVQQGTVIYPPKVTESGTQGGQRVTGIRIGEGRQVTGDERGSAKPVSGTQYIDSNSAMAARAAAPKVGLMRTENGQTVSGTLVRSRTRITGDEAGGSVAITGEADQRLDDDLTPRTGLYAAAGPQFSRQTNPHGSSVFGTNLGRSVASAGSRERTRTLAIEATESGQRITGSAVGRSSRMTGDENGACRSVTGNQYLTPARRQTACGHAGGGTAPVEQAGGDRADPVTAGKVSVSESWGGQRITGMDVEHNRRVTGDEPGSCSALTGSQYQGRTTAAGWCDPAKAGAIAGRRAAAAAPGRVTGDTPAYSLNVTGTARGAGRDVTGTLYQHVPLVDQALPANPVAALDGRFSVSSPQRVSHLKAEQAPARADNAGRITGSFAVGDNKVTGNTEFLPRSRSVSVADKAPAHSRISGEGRDGSQLTGDAWGEHQRVTGVDGGFAADRNPTERGPKAKAFAGSTKFKTLAKTEEPKQLVTGMFYFAKTGARITLSGGAQG